LKALFCGAKSLNSWRPGDFIEWYRERLCFQPNRQVCHGEGLACKTKKRFAVALQRGQDRNSMH